MTRPAGIRAASLAAGLALAGCYDSPRIVDVGPETVTIGYDHRYVLETEAVALAEEYCRDRGRRAERVSRRRKFGGVEMKFHCAAT